MNKNITFHDKCHNRDNCVQHNRCPMIIVHRLISGKWKILIMWYLCGGTLRFSELKKKLPDVTQKMLTNQLRSLEEDGLIYRKVYPIVPPKVEYGLTETGKDILPMLEEMHTFGATYLRNNRTSTNNLQESIAE